MASQSVLEDIDEKFLQCSICLCQLKEPKSLPCLHRYCRDCLAKTVKEKDTDIQCPTCREIYTLPPKGVDGFKTDFNTNNIIEFIQLQDSVKDDPMRKCVACENTLKAESYCFKCRDFLCQSCHKFHTTNTIVKDHRPHIFGLSKAGLRNLTMEKLASLKEAPRCHDHAEKQADLCCATCGNLPICMPCTYGAHRAHDLQEVTSLAKLERGKLIEKTAKLAGYKEKIYHMQDELTKTKEKLDRNVDEKKAELQRKMHLRENRIKEEMRDKDDKLEKRWNKLEEILKRSMSAQKQELEREVKAAQEKYDTFCRDEKRLTDAKLEKLLWENKNDKDELHQVLEVLTKGFRDLLALLQTQQEESSNKIMDLSDHFKDIIERFENITTTASSIVEAKHDWTDVQCIPGVCLAIDPLIEEIKKEFPELQSLTNVKVGGLPMGLGPDITEKEEFAVDIEGGMGNNWTIWDIAGNEDNCIAITGKVFEPDTHITTINVRGKKMESRTKKTDSWNGWRSCTFLTQFKIATVCSYNEIGVYDINNDTYIKTNISDVITSWPTGQHTSCVAVDDVRGHIIVGGYSIPNLYIFDEELKYLKMLTLPEGIEWPRDIIVNSGCLLMCDETGKAAYKISMDGSECKIMTTYTRPDVDEGDCYPRSVCTDRNGFTYMLWRAESWYENKNLIVQYSQDGKKLLQTRTVGCTDDIQCITTVNTEQGEKLVMATERTGKLIICDLS